MLDDELLELLLELELLDPVGSSSQPVRPATPSTAAPESRRRNSRRVGAWRAAAVRGGSSGSRSGMRLAPVNGEWGSIPFCFTPHAAPNICIVSSWIVSSWNETFQPRA